jgi:phenylacetate-CoA ligase
VIVEVVDEEGRHCPPGEMGEIVLTSLNNYVFPFIRYRVGDIGALSDRKCPCGRGLPLLEYVKGRVWDIIVGANGNRLVGTFWLVEGVKGIKQYQLLQREYGELILKLVVDSGFSEKEKAELRRRVSENCGAEMKLNIEIVDRIPPSESGKHRFIISHVSPFVE